MSMNYKEVARGLPEQEVKKYATGISLVADFVDSLQSQGLLPKAFAKGVKTIDTELAKEADPRSQALEFLSTHIFREPNPEEIKQLRPRGYDLILSTDAKSLSLIVAENRSHFWSADSDFVKANSTLRDYIPPALTVALRSKKLFLAYSHKKSQAIQLQMIEEESQAVQKLVPDARAIMLPASTVAQLDLGFFQKTGEVLFRDRFARVLDKTSDFRVARVGRRHPNSQLLVVGWDRRYAGDPVEVLSVVVFLQK